MDSLLNTKRPPVFCPGCSHDMITRTLDKALCGLEIPGNRIAIVSDIGCSGLFDTFFHTHAFHGLHGRALTYATGIKMARPDLHVIVTMGDGGLGIGGAHFLAACRRNIDLTLLILNNFNFGMTGGQFSATSPQEAVTGSGFLNRLEKPMDPCLVASSAGAPYVARCSAYQKDLAEKIAEAISYPGFAVMDIEGICPGRFTKRNKLTPKTIEEDISSKPRFSGEIAINKREDYGTVYSRIVSEQKGGENLNQIEARFTMKESAKREVVILGSAGQRIVTAGELLCLAGMTAGLHVTQKNDYNITVLRGPSISELILSTDEIHYTGIHRPSVVVVLAPEGVQKRKKLFDLLDEDTQVFREASVDIPDTRANVHVMDLKRQKIRQPDWALASLGVLTKMDSVIRMEMLREAIGIRFREPIRSTALEIIDRPIP